MFPELISILTFQAGFNTAVVIVGVSLLGMAAGVVGTFILLRKRALVSDAMGHAALPGVCAAFLAVHLMGIEGRPLPILLAGAALSGALAVVAIQVISRWTRLSEDAAIGAVLSVAFGLGIVLLSVIQTLRTGGQAGLQSFIFGQTAAMSRGEAVGIGMLALVAIVASAALFKEFRLICFDSEFAGAQGWPVFRLDLAMSCLVVLVMVIGLQTVGLILIIALVIVPPVAARFWTDRLWLMAVLSAVFGALSGYAGAAISATVPRVPAGAVIVLVAGAIFLASFFLAPARGVLATALRQARMRFLYLQQEILRHMLRGEWMAHHRTLMDGAVMTTLRWRGLARGLTLTERGEAAAQRATRNFLLWEQFLIDCAGQAPPEGTWGVAPIEDLLTRDTVRELERQLAVRRGGGVAR